jgi:hypothetical protein
MRRREIEGKSAVEVGPLPWKLAANWSTAAYEEMFNHRPRLLNKIGGNGMDPIRFSAAKVCMRSKPSPRVTPLLI